MELACKKLGIERNWNRFSGYSLLFAMALKDGKRVSDLLHVINHKLNIKLVQEILCLVDYNIIMSIILTAEHNIKFFVKWCLTNKSAYVNSFLDNNISFTITQSQDIFYSLAHGTYYLHNQVIPKLLTCLTYPSDWDVFMPIVDIRYIANYAKLLVYLPLIHRCAFAQFLLNNHLEIINHTIMIACEIDYGPRTRTSKKRIRRKQWVEEMRSNAQGSCSEFIHSGYVTPFVPWMTHDQSIKLWEDIYIRMSCIEYCNDICYACTFSYTCNLHRAPITIFPVCIDYWKTPTMQKLIRKHAHRLCFENNNRIDTLLFLTQFVEFNYCIDKRRRYDDQYNCFACLIVIVKAQQDMLRDTFQRNKNTLILHQTRSKPLVFKTHELFEQKFINNLCFAKQFLPCTAIAFIATHSKFESVMWNHRIRRFFNKLFMPYRNTLVNIQDKSYIFKWVHTDHGKYLQCIGYI
jgi:hypothetical protein